MTDNGRTDTCRLDSDDFRRYLLRLYQREKGTVPPLAAVEYVVESLHARVSVHDVAEPVFLRVAPGQMAADTAGEKCYLVDLADAERRAVSIGPEGWEVVDRPPVHFWRSAGLGELPVPARGQSLGILAKYVNVQEFHFPVLLAWLTAALRPVGPYPILVLEGEQGSGKTVLTEVCRRLIDPHMAPLRSMPRGERELMFAAYSNWLIAFDNLSVLSSAQSDALSRLSTGGGFVTRERATDDSEIVIDIKRPIIINGTGEFVKRPDVVDRCVFLPLPPLSPKHRRHNRDYWAEFNRDLPSVLGALYDATAATLKLEGEIKLSELSRMADFDVWGAALAEGQGWPQRKFLDNYALARRVAGIQVIEQVPVVIALSQLLYRHRRVTCTPEALLRALNTYKGRHWPEAGDWPSSPEELAKLLQALALRLRSVGIAVSIRQIHGESVIALVKFHDPQGRSASTAG